jgi:hypothetical protein
VRTRACEFTLGGKLPHPGVSSRKKTSAQSSESRRSCEKHAHEDESGWLASMSLRFSSSLTRACSAASRSFSLLSMHALIFNALLQCKRQGRHKEWRKRFIAIQKLRSVRACACSSRTLVSSPRPQGGAPKTRPAAVMKTMTVVRAAGQRQG